MQPLACVVFWQVDSYEGGFYRAVLATHAEKYDEARRWVDRARSALHPELRAIASDSYSRAHAPLVHAQQLAEAEELVEYKLFQAQLR